MAGEQGKGLRVVDSVVSAPIDVVRGTFDGAANGASAASKPFNDLMNDTDAPGIIRVAAGVTSVGAGVVGAAGGAAVGVVKSGVTGIGRIFGSIFGD